MKDRLRTVILVVASCLLLVLGCAHPRGFTTVCECLNPGNESINGPEVRPEWEKIERRLADHGIQFMVAQCSLTCGFDVRKEQAPEARRLIAEMIRRGEVDAEKLQLKVVEK